MRYIAICLLCGIAVITMAFSVSAEDVDPCNGVKCPIHSKCAVRRDGRVGCACDKGYKAEADKSSCKPEPPKECVNTGDCPNRRVCFQNRCMTKNQRLTIKAKGVNLIVPGVILIAVGGAAIIAGAIITAENESSDADDIGDAISAGYATMVGIPLLAPGIIVLATGAILLAIGLEKRKKIKSGQLAFDIKTRHGKLTLEPAIAAGENGGVFGLSGRF